MANVGNPFTVLELGDIQAAAGTLGLELITIEIRHPQDIVPAFEALKGRSEALYVCTDALINTNRIRINILAVGARLPTMYGSRDYVEAGGLMSYGANFPDSYRRAAGYVDKILRGTKPGDIPVEQPTKFDLIINLTTAKALGLTIPETFRRGDRIGQCRLLAQSGHHTLDAACPLLGVKRTLGDPPAPQVPIQRSNTALVASLVYNGTLRWG
jgi:putative ABC transport system substrate-binding protein